MKKRERAAKPRWAPTFAVSVKPVALPTRIRDELIRLAKCPGASRGEFIERIEIALGSYRAAKRAIAAERPAMVRARLAMLRRAVARAVKMADGLPQTCIPIRHLRDLPRRARCVN